MHRPTLLGVQGQAHDILEKYGAGVLLQAANEQDFIERMAAFEASRKQPL